MREPFIYFDGKKCIACHSCEVSCQLENDALPGLQLRWVRKHELGHLPGTRLLSVSTACFHCQDPSCVSACPAGALRRRADGVVEHIRSRCIGCGYCVRACPFHVPKVSLQQHTMRKCSFCIQRIDHGEKPACVAKCPSGALTFYADAKEAPKAAAYGRKEGLHMVYALEDEASAYNLPDPVPLNTVVPWQLWKWLSGFVPGAVLIGLLWKYLSKGVGHE
jgi:anaerobic dimethyl sulfoxide reductase subunit B (iron-sulfur subunit)